MAQPYLSRLVPRLSPNTIGLSDAVRHIGLRRMRGVEERFPIKIGAWDGDGLLKYCDHEHKSISAL